MGSGTNLWFGSPHKQGWVPRQALLLATALTTSYAFTAGSSDEAGFNAQAKVYGFQERDGWWDGYVPDSKSTGMFPGNYVTADEPQPAFLKPSPPPLPPAFNPSQLPLTHTPVPPPQPSPASSAATTRPPVAQVPAPSLPSAQSANFFNPMLKNNVPAAVAAAAPAAPAAGQPTPSQDSSNGKAEREFKGALPQQFAIWGHYMALYAAFTLFWCGLFTVLWANGDGWSCMIEGEWIHDSLIVNTTFPDCEEKEMVQRRLLSSASSAAWPLASMQAPPRELAHVANDDECCAAGLGGGACCNPWKYSQVNLGGSLPFGLYGVGLSVLIFVLEYFDGGYGLWQPSDSSWYRRGISPLALFYGAASVPLFFAIPNAFAGACLLLTAICQQWSFKRFESGDGGRRDRQAKAARAAAAKAKRQEQNTAAGKKNLEFEYPLDWYKGADLAFVVLHPIAFLRKLHQEDKLSTVFWLLVYFFVNAYLFFSTLAKFEKLIDDLQPSLLDGTVDLSVAANRQAVRFGFLSRVAPWAKASGGCLNFNCALIAMPVTKLLLARLNNFGKSYSKMQAGNSLLAQYFGRFFAHPFTRCEVHTLSAFCFMLFQRLSFELLRYQHDLPCFLN